LIDLVIRQCSAYTGVLEKKNRMIEIAAAMVVAPASSGRDEESVAAIANDKRSRAE
jgi:hypothetical protein